MKLSPQNKKGLIFLLSVIAILGLSFAGALFMHGNRIKEFQEKGIRVHAKVTNVYKRVQGTKRSKQTSYWADVIFDSDTLNQQNDSSTLKTAHISIGTHLYETLQYGDTIIIAYLKDDPNDFEYIDRVK